MFSSANFFPKLFVYVKFPRFYTLVESYAENVLKRRGSAECKLIQGKHAIKNKDYLGGKSFPFQRRISSSGSFRSIGKQIPLSYGRNRNFARLRRSAKKIVFLSLRTIWLRSFFPRRTAGIYHRKRTEKLLGILDVILIHPSTRISNFTAIYQIALIDFPILLLKLHAQIRPYLLFLL